MNDCDKPLVARGWCRMHYMRWSRWGSPEAHNSRHGMTPTERFWDQVAKGGDGCWIWNGTRSGGYGLFTVTAGPNLRRTMHAHRFAYEDLIGPIPEGLELDHLCRVRACVRPDHLEPVTALLNKQRTRREECIHGHRLSEENVYTKPDGSRQCKPCRRETDRRRRVRTSSVR